MRRVLLLVPLLLATAWVVYAGAGGSFAPACAPTGRTKIAEGIEFVEIGAGTFLMGSNANGELPDLLGRVCRPLDLPLGDQGKISREMPVHRVTFPRPFWIAKYEITNEQYERFDSKHERDELSSGDRDPVMVSWENATAYCSWLAEKTGHPVRLPSEAEWEAACRAGSRSRFCFGDDEERLGEFAWFDGNSDGRAHEVGTRRANEWGLHDLHGNVREWVEDRYYWNYEGAQTDGSAWTAGGRPAGSPYRVCRGGTWYIPAKFCRSAFRACEAHDSPYESVGFRPAMGPLDD